MSAHKIKNQASSFTRIKSKNATNILFFGPARFWRFVYSCNVKGWPTGDHNLLLSV